MGGQDVDPDHAPPDPERRDHTGFQCVLSGISTRLCRQRTALRCQLRLTLTGWRGFNSSLRYRHISAYILDGTDSTNPAKRATGLDVLDLSIAKQIRHGLEINVGIDNLNNKQYWETQNYLASRLPGEPVDGVERIHATPGYPISVTAGLTLRLGEK